MLGTRFFHYFVVLLFSDCTQGLYLLKEHPFLLFENASMLCLYGKGQPNVTWFGPNGTSISLAMNKYKEKVDNGKSILFIYNITESDYGTYTCRGFTGREISTKLIVLGRVLNLRQVYQLKIGGSSHLKFLVRGRPQPLLRVWRKGGTADFLVAEWKAGKISTINPKFSVSPYWGLNISNAQLEDERLYEIELGMYGNQAKVNFFLNVSEVPPKILREKSTSYILYLGKRKYVPISCLSEGKPLPAISLLRNGTPIVKNRTSSHLYYKANSTWLYQIQSSRDIVNLTCLIKNKLGEIRHKIVLDEIKLPSIPRNVDVTVKANHVDLVWSQSSFYGGDDKIFYTVRYCNSESKVCHGGKPQVETAKTLKNLQYSTTYKIYVAALNRRGEGEAFTVEIDIGLKVPLDIVLPIAIVVMAFVAIVGCFCCYVRSKRAKRRSIGSVKRKP